MTTNSPADVADEQDFPFRFEDDGSGFDLSFEVDLDTGETVAVALTTAGTGSRYAFLAAIGADLSDVARFPLIHLADGGFVPREGTDLQITIDGVAHEPTRVPVKVEGVKSYRTVYAFSPRPFFWNEEQSGTRVEAVEASGAEVEHGGLTWTLVENGGHAEIQAAAYTARGHTSFLRFSPPLPDVAAMAPGQALDGRFCFGVDDELHVVCGDYAVSSLGGRTLELAPTSCWQPMPGQDWVSTYRYRASYASADEGALTVDSEWTVGE